MRNASSLAAAIEPRDLGHHDPDEGSSRASLGLMMATGGDSRIWIDPYTGRNRYGVRTRPSPDEISFASTTASTVSPAGFARAGRALGALIRGGLSPEQWLDDIRAEIARYLGTPDTSVVLAASGTDAELIALALVTGASPRPLTNILIAPAETGSGVPLAAAGRHFLGATALGAEIAPGTPVAGLPVDEITIATIGIRQADGTPRPADEVDADTATAVEAALLWGRDVLLHVLDTSKTGLTCLTRAMARRLRALAPDRVHVVVDACQLRCRPEQIRQDLADGFMVIVTGSKFAGGPPFSGALLLPPDAHDHVAAGRPLARGLADYSAAQDWPEALRTRLGGTLTTELNIGLGLRWEAALDGIAATASVTEHQHLAILARFRDAVRQRATRTPGLAAIEGEGTAASVVALTVLRADGQPADIKHAQRIHERLRDEDRGPVCHVGQTVALGERNVLRVAASAIDVAAVAQRMAGGLALEQAFEPVDDHLAILFGKWAEITRAGV